MTLPTFRTAGLRSLLVIGAIWLGADTGTADAQKITLDATKRKIELVDDLYVLSARLLTEAAALKLGYEPEQSKVVLDTAFAEVDRHLKLLLEGEEGTELEREHSVALQGALAELRTIWATYGADLQALAGHAEVTTDQLMRVLADGQAFAAKVTTLVDTVYDVYGEEVFTDEELRAVTLLAHERAHIETMKEEMLLAAAVPEEHDASMKALAELSNVFSQTMDVLIRNHAMYGVAPPPEGDATASLALVEEHWQAKAALIEEIEADDTVTVDEIGQFFTASETLSKELDVAILAYHAAMHGH
jgi:hypothetical protein